jgi:hypothetical protein
MTWSLPIPWYAFEEVLAAFGDASGALGSADTMLSQVEAMGQRIASDRTLHMPQIVAIDRSRVLAKYLFGDTKFLVENWSRAPNINGTLRGQSAIDTSASIVDDVLDTEFQRNVLEKEQLWRVSGFSWRYLLSRRELDLFTDGDRKDFSRNMAYYFANSQRGQSFFRSLDFAFVLNCILSALMLWVAYPSLKNLSPITQLFPLLVILTFAITWLLLAFVSAVVAILLLNPPHGVRLFEVVNILSIRPMRGYIRDYQKLHK